MASGTGARVGAVDTLRCLAMTAVVAQHCGLLPFGWTGVWLFFVISGAVVTGSVIGRPWQAGLAGARDFWRRRARRILPVYYAYVAVGLLVMLWAGERIDLVAALSLAGFVNNLAMIAGRGELAGWPVGHLWTISVEMQFYLVYGLLLFLAPRRLTVAMLVAALVAGPLLRAAAAHWLQVHAWAPGDASYAVYAGSFMHIDAFAAGALLAHAHAAGRLDRIARPLAAAGAAALLFYAAGYVAVNWAIGDRGINLLRDVISGVPFGQHREILLYSAITAASSGLLALALTRDPLVDRLLCVPALQWIGLVSYGGYVLHGLAIHLVLLQVEWLGLMREALPIWLRLVVFAATYALTLAMAALSWRTLEARFRGGSAPRPRTEAVEASAARS